MRSALLLKKLLIPFVLSSIATTGLVGYGLRRRSRQPRQPLNQQETTRERSNRDQAEIEEIFQNHNIYTVYNGPTNPTKFTINEIRHIYSIENYHWNDSQGKSPGTISLEAEDGTVYGPWQTTGREGQGGIGASRVNALK